MTMRYFLTQDKIDKVYEVVQSDLDMVTFRALLNYCKAECPEAYGDTELVGQLVGDLTPYTYTQDEHMFAGFHSDFRGPLPEAFVARCEAVVLDTRLAVQDVSDALLNKLYRKGLPS